MASLFTRREWLFSAASLPLHAIAPAAAFSFWTFSLLRPPQLRLRAEHASRLHCRGPFGKFVLESGESHLLLADATPFCASGPGRAPAPFRLEVPGVLRRRFYGTLQVCRIRDFLAPVITMPLEIAVSAIIGAELPLSRAPVEAQMAQAVIARSFMLGTPAPRHAEAFFCDTTHCQFLRSPAPCGSAAYAATAHSSGIALASDGAVFPASYSAACGGITEAGERDGHCYISVRCRTCRALRLRRRGHGWGLCQEGAMELAREGMKWRQILDYYFPNASLRYQ
jgi:hypothetical protein